MLIGGVEGSALSSKPRPFPHSVLPVPRGTVLTGGVEGSALSSKHRPFPHKISIRPPRGAVLIDGIHVVSSLIQHRVPHSIAAVDIPRQQ